MPNVAQIQGLNVVLIGEFNPTIFQPAWFAAQGLLTQLEADNATVGVIHPDVTQFELPWIRLTVERERFTAVCLAHPYFEQLVGTVCRTFDVLKHTPVHLFGLNFEAHYRASSIDKWHALGHKLAPKEFWTQFFENPGMQSVMIKEEPRSDGLGGHVQIKVEPSIRVVPGVYAVVNSEVRSKDGKSLGAERTTELIQEHWPKYSEFSERVFSTLAAEIE